MLKCLIACHWNFIVLKKWDIWYVIQWFVMECHSGVMWCSHTHYCLTPWGKHACELMNRLLTVIFTLQIFCSKSISDHSQDVPLTPLLHCMYPHQVCMQITCNTIHWLSIVYHSSVASLWGWHYDNATPLTEILWVGWADRIWTHKYADAMVILSL